MSNKMILLILPKVYRKFCTLKKILNFFGIARINWCIESVRYQNVFGSKMGSRTTLISQKLFVVRKTQRYFIVEHSKLYSKKFTSYNVKYFF